MSARSSAGSVARFPTIVNMTMTLADTEYEYELPENCKSFIIHTRDESAFRFAYETGYVATPMEPYFTVPATKALGDDGFLNYTHGGVRMTLYFASGSAGKVIEIIHWT